MRAMERDDASSRRGVELPMHFFCFPPSFPSSFFFFRFFDDACVKRCLSRSITFVDFFFHRRETQNRHLGLVLPLNCTRSLAPLFRRDLRFDLWIRSTLKSRQFNMPAALRLHTTMIGGRGRQQSRKASSEVSLGRCSSTSTTTTVAALLPSSRRVPNSSSTKPAARITPSFTTSRPRAATVVVAAAALRNVDQPQALLFDCDGVLLESEAVGHRNSFNAAFKEEEALKPDEHEW